MSSEDLTPGPLASYSRGPGQIDPCEDLEHADVLLIVPPFAAIDRPSLALHLLQSLAQEEGLSVQVLYANILFAAEIGEELYSTLCYLPSGMLTGEHIFAPAAFGKEVCDFRLILADMLEGGVQAKRFQNAEYLSAQLISIVERVPDWVDWLSTSITRADYQIFGCTSTFEQTAASWSILNGIKSHRPQAVTILGGANCDGEMAAGLASLLGGPDYIFSGESESSFPRFLREALAGTLPSGRVISGRACVDLDALPVPNYAEYYRQIRRWLPDTKLVANGTMLLPYESSRGCWWGEKHHCTFCGLNGNEMKFREKSAAKVLSDLDHLMREHPTRQVCMTDNIMPYRYFNTLIPRLAEARTGAEIFYEQKANLTLEKMSALSEAGVRRIQPGIESLSTSLLRLMKKGVTAKQNVGVLRYARSLGIRLNWNLLYAFPGDRESSYEEMLELLPFLRHLEPPSGCFPLSIERFSPYFDSPALFGIDELHPAETYSGVFPEDAPIEKIAYHFAGDYETAARRDPELIESIQREVASWTAPWRQSGPAPTLWVSPLAEDLFLLIDTRLAELRERVEIISRTQAKVALLEHRELTPDVEWGLDHHVCVLLDSVYVPLGVSSPDVLRRFALSTIPLTEPAPEVAVSLAPIGDLVAIRGANPLSEQSRSIKMSPDAAD